MSQIRLVADSSCDLLSLDGVDFDINGDGDVDTKDLVNLVKKVSKG